MHLLHQSKLLTLDKNNHYHEVISSYHEVIPELRQSEYPRQ